MLPEALVDELIEFRRQRDWEQFHSPRNIAAAVAVEAAELLEHFVWAKEDQVESIVADKRAHIAAEIADIVILISYLARDLGIDIDSAVQEKVRANASRYPVEKSRGSNKKYSEL